MCLTVDEEALSDVLYSQLILVCDVKFVETLSNDLVEVLVEKLFYTHFCLFRFNELVVIVEEEVANAFTLIVSKLFA